HIVHQTVHVISRQFMKLIHVIFIRHKATTTIGLLTKQKQGGHFKVTDFYHQRIGSVLTIEACRIVKIHNI
ncbi:MAG TPA: hypothetical protein DEO38_04765, partial [Bacteroidales bacterium]|nr:hypothetical protein [Bacteroidales bacterium]